MEKELYDNLVCLPKRIEKDSDVVGAFVGSPGDGKSTLAQQCLYLLDKNHSISSIHWNYETYVKYCSKLFTDNKSRGKGVIHDEGKESLSSMTMMGKRTRLFMNFLYEQRQMNMYHFILTGDFFDLPKSIVMQRLMFMIYVHEDGEFDKGFFKFYNREALRKLYIRGKKERNMAASGYNFRGTFSAFYPAGDAEYRKMKRDNMQLERYIEKIKEKEITVKEILEAIWSRNPNPKPSEVIRVLNIEPAYYFRVKKAVESTEY